MIVGFSLVVLHSLHFPFSGNLAISSQPFEEGVLAPFSAHRGDEPKPTDRGARARP